MTTHTSTTTNTSTTADSENRHVALPGRSPSPYRAEDPRTDFNHAVAIAGVVIDHVTDASLRLPTPCSEFDVEALTRHLISVAHRVVALGQGLEAESIPLDAPGVETGAWTAAWAETATELASVWADDGLLGQDMVLPFATLPGAVTLPIYAAEILIHAWDLATALGLAPAWDQQLAEAALATIVAGIPEDGRGPDMPFDPVVATVEGAPAMDRLVAWLGRRPATAL